MMMSFSALGLVAVGGVLLLLVLPFLAWTFGRVDVALARLSISSDPAARVAAAVGVRSSAATRSSGAPRWWWRRRRSLPAIRRPQRGRRFTGM